LENKVLLYKRIRAEQRHQQGLIRIYLHTFENGFSDIKTLIENINSIILKKAERTEKSRIFLLKADKMAGL